MSNKITIKPVNHIFTQRNFIQLLGFLFTSILLLNCEKKNDIEAEGKAVEIYQLEKFEKESGTDKIIESSVVLGEKPIISYNEILSYNPVEHAFELAEGVEKTFNQQGGLKYHFKSFALTVDGKIIYTGYFMPPYASSVRNWYSADPIRVSLNRILKIDMAYPDNNFVGQYPDQRNDQKIIITMMRDGKLKD